MVWFGFKNKIFQTVERVKVYAIFLSAFAKNYSIKKIANAESKMAYNFTLSTVWNILVLNPNQTTYDDAEYTHGAT